MKKWFTVLAILLLLILGVNMISNLNKYEYGYFTDDFIEDDQRPIMLVDLMSSSDYEKALQSGDNKEEENYYRQRTSILVPKQTEVYESVKVKDDTGAHRLSLFSTSYQGRYKWISERMVEAIKNEHPYPHEDYQLIDQNGFDEIWTRNDNDSASLIVRIENDVYRVEYETRGLGEDVQDRILKRMSELSF